MAVGFQYLGYSLVSLLLQYFISTMVVRIVFYLIIVYVTGSHCVTGLVGSGDKDDGKDATW